MHCRSYFSALSAILISSCSADYLNHYDSVTLAAGDANRSNMLLQTVDPFNPNSQNTHIEGDGARAVAAFNAYRGVPAGGGKDLDCAGGKGNNPVVKGPVAVGASDPNGLDRNHNGIGCE
ncbi:calcium-binding protein [Mesorhizobium sp. ISC11]|uniref:calcium-binding protein n=1 Tax=Mesorhizobium sp. ISC11 TaxID=3076428 RepID=UPI00301C30BD